MRTRARRAGRGSCLAGVAAPPRGTHAPGVDAGSPSDGHVGRRQSPSSFALTAAAALALSLATPTPAWAEPDAWLGPDKALHGTVAAGLALTGYAAALPFSFDVAPRIAVGAGTSLLLGVAKELADLAGGGQASWKDLAWDAIGCALGVLTAVLIDRLIVVPLAQADGVH